MEPGARCETCNNGYNISTNGNCLKCEENTPPIPNCVILEECDKCGMCSKGYYIDDDDGSCVKCEDHTCCPGNTHNHPSASGCLTCSGDQKKCDSCPINTTLKSGMGDGRSCVPCSSNECCGEGNRGTIGEHCHSCTSDMSECGSCESGYKLISGTCVSCGSNECCYSGNRGDIISHCYSCSADLMSCLGCEFGMKLNGSSCVSCSSDECCPSNTTTPITSHCDVCSTDHKSCRTCKSGYNNSGGICVEIESRDGGSSVGVIVGVVVGVIVFGGIVIFIIIYFIIFPNNKNNKNNKNKNDDDISKKDSVDMNGLEVFDEIGHGSTSVVYKGRYNGKDVAVKVMRQDGSGVFSREIELMMKLKNPFIIEVYDKCVISGHDGYVMEYVGMGSLCDVIHRQVMSDGLKMRYVREICMGMRYLHSMNIIHRDLKLENILVLSVSESDTRDAICKISDFGTARETDISNTLTMTQSKTMSMTMTSNIGTLLYMAPEILSGQSHYSQKADIYSYGIVLCGIWNQQIPYSDESFENVTEFLTQVVNQGHRPSLKPDCPQPYIQLVSACLQSDPHSRPSFEEISKTVFGVN